MPEEERLQKILARAGFGSRRKCEDIVASGRVSINGVVADTPGSKAVAGVDLICVDGVEIAPDGPPVYIMFNKPAGCLSAASDDIRNRDTVMDYLRDAPARVFHVGRLDYDTEGLLLFSNDGDFAQKVIHPGFKVKKTYLARVRCVPSTGALERLRSGIELDDGPTAPAAVKLLEVFDDPESRPGRKGALIEIIIHEGRKRQVRRMLRAVGCPVVELRRTRIGALLLGDLEPGHWRLLDPAEAALALGEAPVD